MSDDFMEKFATRLLTMDYDGWAPILMPDGSARQQTWVADDDWLIVYTTERVHGGRWNGRFVTMAYKPTGKGSRSGRAESWKRVYARAFVSRKAAKARALALWHQHERRSE